MSRWGKGGWQGSLTLTQGLRSSLRCPFAGDNYRTQLVPVGPATLQMPFPSHYQRFAISTFAFVDSPSMVVLEGEVRQGCPPAQWDPAMTPGVTWHRVPQVYILCSASVCHLSQPEPCRPSCQEAMPSRKWGCGGGPYLPLPFPNQPLCSCPQGPDELQGPGRQQTSWAQSPPGDALSCRRVLQWGDLKRVLLPPRSSS